MSITDNLIALLAERPEAYPQNDIGIARLFYDLHRDVIRIPEPERDSKLAH